MKNLRKSIIITLLVCLSFVFTSMAAADCSALRCVGKITRLYIDSDNLYIGTDGDESLLSCPAVADVYLTLPSTDPAFDRKYAMLLTAMTLGQEVNFRADINSSNCTILYTTIDIPTD